MPSIRHTGTRFTRELLSGSYQWTKVTGDTPPPNPLFSAHIEGDRTNLLLKFAARFGNCVVPLRHPRACARSCMKRGKDLGLYLDSWRTLVEKVDMVNPVYLPVDSPRRESFLSDLGEYLGLSLSTEWAPVGADEREVEPCPVWDRAVDELCDRYSRFLGRFYD